MGKKLIVDSDFLVALYKPNDASHVRAVKVFQDLIKTECEFIALNLIFYESTTVVSHKMGMTDARKFHANFMEFITRFIVFDSDLEIDTWKIFLAQTKKGCSFNDCANLAVIEKYKLDGILSFDEFYPKKLLIGQ